MPIYTKQDIQNFNSKDKRISFLSLFSSLTNMWQGNSTTPEKYKELIDTLKNIAYEVNDSLYEKYQIVDENNQDKAM
jgi:hypothetical protein